MSKIYKTARGKEIDMNKLINQNEMTVAVGNMNVNARGDRLGPGGTIIKPPVDTTNGILVPDENQKPEPQVEEPKQKTKKSTGDE